MNLSELNMTPRTPRGLLRWSDTILDLVDLLGAVEPPAYIVGGAVRDALLGRPIKDIDIATSASGMSLARTIANRLRGKYYALDPDRDVGRALIDTADGRLEIDVARFRGADLAADLLDRDFTMNAMAVDLRDMTHLIDPLDGEADMLAKVVRRCNPDSLARDPIRALRAVRQSIQFNMRIAPETLADVRVTGEKLNHTSAERVRDEFFKLLSLPKASAALRVANHVGLLAVIIPEVRDVQAAGADQWALALTTVEQMGAVVSVISPNRTDESTSKFSLGMLAVGLGRHRAKLQDHLLVQWADDRSHRALLSLAALLPPLEGVDMATAVSERAAALRLSNHERARLTGLVANRLPPGVLPETTPLALHRFWYPLHEVGVDVCLLALADYLASARSLLVQDDWLVVVERVQQLLTAYFDQHDQIVDPALVVDGNLLMKQLHLKPGRMVGDLLTRIREAQVTGEVSTAEDALELARRYLGRL